MRITDCHVHVNPIWEMRPEARALIERHPALGDVERLLREPDAFLALLDRAGIDRAVLVNYVSPDVIGYTERSNEFVRDYVRGHADRLIAVGSVLPTHRDVAGTLHRYVEEYGIRGIKLHPPHQLFAPNAYLDGAMPGLRELYETAQGLSVPVIFHTGTSIFPGARNRYGEPLLVEDVAIDFPDLTIVLAHGGRPIWMREATFLARRFPNVFLEISSVPPARLLEYFPDLEKIQDKVLYGSDFPGPGVPDLATNLQALNRLPLSSALKEKMLETNPMKVFPPRAPL
jgi:predicted TIM-barrel fold metal-dependent hydrolase